MSILSDLAPENSKLPANTPHEGKPPVIAWLLALLMLAGGGIWLSWSMQQSASTTPTPPTSAQGAESASMDRAQPTTLDQVPTDIARTSGASSATILRSEVPAKAGHPEQPSENIFQTMQKELENSPSRMQTSERATREAAMTNQRKEGNRGVASGKSQAKATSPAKQNPKAGNKKHEERDIEIISAIVK